MTLFRALHDAGGIMRTRAAQDRGWSRFTIAKHLEERRLVRPRHGWIALPDADPQVLYAVAHGALLSCMSVVARHRLWVPKPLTRPHLAARAPKARVVAGDHVCHWGVPVMQREPHRVVDRLENALVFVVACVPAEEALAVWESALRSGSVTRAALARLPLRQRERALLDECSEFSDSGLESYVGRRLRALRLKVVAQAWLLGHRADFLIEDWLILEIDGGHHVGEQRDSDNTRDAVRLVNGYVTIRVGARQVERDWPSVQRLIMTAISQGRPR